MSQISLKYKLLTIIPIIALLLFVFQNCADPMDDGLSGLSKSMMFPYDVRVDHLAYMSCTVNKTVDTDMYFDFKVAAITPQSGLKFTEEFQEATKLHSDVQIAEILANDELFMGAQLQLSIRQRNNLNMAMSESGAYKNILYPLDNGLIVKEFVNLEGPNERFNFLSYVSGLMDRSLEGSLVVDNNAMYKKAYFHDDNNILTLGYTSEDIFTSELSMIKPDLEDNKKAFGVGFSLQFSADGRKVNAIEEVNLLTGESENASTWHCPEDMKFTIVRYQDVQNMPAINIGPDTYGNEPPDIVNKISRARAILDPDKSRWHIDYNNGNGPALIPKSPGSDCYSASDGNNSDKPVNYGYPLQNNDGCGYVGSYYICPHHVSICCRGPCGN